MPILRQNRRGTGGPNPPSTELLASSILSVFFASNFATADASSRLALPSHKGRGGFKRIKRSCFELKSGTVLQKKLKSLHSKPSIRRRP